jgi:hypothetical protein
VGRRKYLQADLAREIGLSPAAVSRLKQRGMPVHSTQAARAWREANLDPALMKQARSPAERAPLGAIRVDIARQFGQLALIEFATWEAQLRAAMGAVPVPWRERVELPVEVWDQLVGDLHGLEDGSPGAEGNDEVDDDFVGDILYRLASGEAAMLAPADPTNER